MRIKRKDFRNILAAGILVLAIGSAAAGCADSQPQPGNPATGPVSGSAAPSSAPAQTAAPSEPPEPVSPSVLESVEFRSEALGQTKRLKVYLPPGYDESREYPVLYMLHGYSGTESAWMPQMRLEKTADRLIGEGRIEPLIIVAPQMDNSYGLNSSETYRVAVPDNPSGSRYYGRYEDYFIMDVLGYVDEHYSTISSREGRYVGGYSMGGFISLHAAFRHPDLFSKAGGHSPALWLDDWSRVPLMKSWLYPNAAARRERDPVQLAEYADLQGLSVYLDCGDKDDFRLYEGTEKLYGILKERGVASEYHLNPGKHDRAYWQSQSENYLLFYAAKS